jgi:hypothetical protein
MRAPWPREGYGTLAGDEAARPLAHDRPEWTGREGMATTLAEVPERIVHGRQGEGSPAVGARHA